MTTTPDPCGEAELHALADGLLDPASAAAVETRLAAEPAAKERVAGWRRQNELILALSSDQAGEPLPLRLRPARLRRRRRRELRRLAAAVLLALLAGGGGGWLGHDLWPADTDLEAALVGAAARGHRDLPDALELGHALSGGDPRAAGEQLSRWIDRRLVVPDLSLFGLRLVGAQAARAAAGDRAALLAYEDAAATRFTLYLTRAVRPPEPVVSAAAGAGRAAAWSYEELRCVLIADASPERLRAIVRGVNAQFERAE